MLFLTERSLLTWFISLSPVTDATHGDECQRHLYIRSAEYLGITHF